MTLPPTARHRGTHAKVALRYSEVGDIWGTANVQACCHTQQSASSGPLTAVRPMETSFHETMPKNLGGAPPLPFLPRHSLMRSSSTHSGSSS